MGEKETLAARILSLNNLWEHTSKAVMAENIEKYLYAKYPSCKASYKAKMEKLQEISGSQKDTVYAWLNRSRADVKVPFFKLCRISEALGIDISEMFISR